MKGQIVCLCFSFIFVFVLLLLLLLINLSFILIIIYLCFFFSHFQFVLIDLHFGVIPSSRIDRCLKDVIGNSGGAHFGFSDERSYFKCNEKVSGHFLKGLQLNYVIQFFLFFFASYFYLISSDAHMYLKIFG
jgi:uncharacterized membrane protein